MSLPKVITCDSESSAHTDSNESESSTELSEDEFEVEKLVGKRTDKGVLKYKVRWVGYDATDDTWENVDNLNCPAKIEEYERELEQKKATKRTRTASRSSEYMDISDDNVMPTAAKRLRSTTPSRTVKAEDVRAPSSSKKIPKETATSKTAPSKASTNVSAKATPNPFLRSSSPSKNLPSSSKKKTGTLFDKNRSGAQTDMTSDQQVITDYLNTLNQYILYSQFNVTEQFSDVLTALKLGSSLMNEQLQSIKLEESKENSVKEMKHKNALNESETSDIFSRFPHSALKTPSMFPDAASNSKKETIESVYSTSTNSITELYQNIAKAPGLKSFKKIFPAVLKSPDLSLVNESSNTSVLVKSAAASGQSSIISPITRRKPRKNIRPLTPTPFADSSRSRRAAAPASLKEPSLKKKMRRT